MRSERGEVRGDGRTADVTYRYIYPECSHAADGETGDNILDIGGGYFAAANSHRGFLSYFDELITRRSDRHLILKGGPGTGKSYFIRRAAKRAAELGGVVECYYCSSDPESLDGMLAFMPSGEVLGIRDGTAPHAAEATLPGVRDEIFDLGAFWNDAALRGEAQRIEKLGAAKSRAWEGAFNCLAAAGRISVTLRGRLGTALDGEKLERAAARAAGDAERRALERDGGSSWLGRAPGRTPEHAPGSLPSELVGTACGSPRVLHSPHCSCGMRGCAALAGIYDGAREVFLTSDEPLPGMGELFITAMAGRLEHSARAGREIECRISPDPIRPELAVAVRCGRSVYTCERTLPSTLPADVARHRIGLRRFLRQSTGGDAFSSAADRHELCRLEELYRRAVMAAVREAGAAADCHFALEAIYSAAMDIPSLNVAEEKRIEEFFGKLL